MRAPAPGPRRRSEGETPGEEGGGRTRSGGRPAAGGGRRGPGRRAGVGVLQMRGPVGGPGVSGEDCRRPGGPGGQD